MTCHWTFVAKHNKVGIAEEIEFGNLVLCVSKLS